MYPNRNPGLLNVKQMEYYFIHILDLDSESTFSVMALD